MKLNLKKRDGLILLALFLFFGICGLINNYLLAPVALVFLIALGMEFYYRIKKFQKDFARRAKYNYQQIEAYSSFTPFLNLKRPLPSMRGAAISPDAAKIIVDLVLDKKSKTVIEFGSGVSTIIVSYLLKNFGAGKIISLDHNKEYVRVTRDNLYQHGVAEFAKVIYASLEINEFNKKKYKWYRKDFLQELDKVDLVIVDGPPRRVGKLARYPALPVLYEKLNDGASIIIDDAKRQSIQKMIKLWLEEYKDFDFEYFDTEKGTVILTKK